MGPKETKWKKYSAHLEIEKHDRNLHIMFGIKEAYLLLEASNAATQIGLAMAKVQVAILQQLKFESNRTSHHAEQVGVSDAPSSCRS